MYNGFAVFSLERELSFLEKRKDAIKNKIDTIRLAKAEGQRLQSPLRLPPLPTRENTRLPSRPGSRTSLVEPLPDIGHRKYEDSQEPGQGSRAESRTFTPRPPSSSRNSRNGSRPSSRCKVIFLTYFMEMGV